MLFLNYDAHSIEGSARGRERTLFVIWAILEDTEPICTSINSQRKTGLLISY